MRWNWSIHVYHTYAIDIGKPSATSLIKNHPHFWYLCIDLWVRVEYLYYIYGTTNCEATHRLQSDICQCRYFDYVSEILVRRTLKILFRINWIVSGFFLCVCVRCISLTTQSPYRLLRVNDTVAHTLSAYSAVQLDTMAISYPFFPFRVVPFWLNGWIVLPMFTFLHLEHLLLSAAQCT